MLHYKRFNQHILAHQAFKAMGSPCEFRVYVKNAKHAEAALALAHSELRRLEDTYSRYRSGNLMEQVNAAGAKGGSIKIPEELERLLDYANLCFEMSDGLFDITSGSLRKIWNFKERKIPTEKQCEQALQTIGWKKLVYGDGLLEFTVRGMELDFGGIVKEYAVDAMAGILREQGIEHGAVDLGGDIFVLGPHPDGKPWIIDIAHPRNKGKQLARLFINYGGLASSGDYERFIEINGSKYCHLMSPKTGWPVKAMAAASVVADQCVIAGSASTIAMLKEDQANTWLTEMGLPCVWMNDKLQSGHLNTFSSCHFEMADLSKT